MDPERFGSSTVADVAGALLVAVGALRTLGAVVVGLPVAVGRGDVSVTVGVGTIVVVGDGIAVGVGIVAVADVTLVCVALGWAPSPETGWSGVAFAIARATIAAISPTPASATKARLRRDSLLCLLGSVSRPSRPCRGICRRIASSASYSCGSISSGGAF
jgi:hypothetical protein